MSLQIRLRNPTASFFIPDGKTAKAAFQRTTHLGIGAHQDDLVAGGDGLLALQEIVKIGFELGNAVADHHGQGDQDQQERGRSGRADPAGVFNVSRQHGAILTILFPLN